MIKPEKRKSLTRRKFIGGGLGLFGLTLALKPAAILAQAPAPPPDSAAPSASPPPMVVGEDDLKTLQKKGSVFIGPKKRPILLFKMGEKSFSAFSALCTHEGCRVNYKTGWGEIRCPCHGSVYDLTGTRKEGPAKRALDRYAVETIDGRLAIRLPAAVHSSP